VCLFLILQDRSGTNGLDNDNEEKLKRKNEAYVFSVIEVNKTIVFVLKL